MKQIKNIKLLTATKMVLQDLRAETGLSQGDVITDIIDLKNVTINLGRIETGKGDISATTLFLLCEYYKVPISIFFKRVEEIDIKLKINDQE